MQADYPDSLIDTWSPGEVMIQMRVEETGNIRVERVLSATHPDFVAPAVLAARKWKCEPARRQGKPEACSVTQNFTFFIAKRGYNVSNYHYGLKLQKRTPEASGTGYDRNPSVICIANPVYPYDLAVSGTQGSAEVEFTVNEVGQVTATQVLAATRPEFAGSLVAMTEAVRLTPAIHDRELQKFTVRKKQDFGSGENFLTYNRQTKRILREIRSGQAKFALPEQLDFRPAPLYQPAPVYPLNLLAQRQAGETEIEFFIDEDGRAQLPRVISATHPEFGWAAATAVGQWVFEQPMMKGKPTIVRTRIPMAFKLPTSAH